MDASGLAPLKRALISVSDKTGLAERAAKLADAGVELLSTGGTLQALRDAGLEARDVSSVTEYPEMMDGRVKTLHPRIHGGLLARRDNEDDLAAMAEHGIPQIDLLVVNLYPFEETARSGADIDACIQKIDVGGPAMIRAAAKNHNHVAVCTDMRDLDKVLEVMAEHHGQTTLAMRRHLAGKAFARTAAYDSAIAARFEPEREVRFSTYAAWWIRSSIQDYVLRNWSIVRTGTTSSHKTLFFNLRRIRAMINDINGGEISPENRAKTAKALRVPEKDVDAMASRLAASDRSLNAPFTEDGEGEWQDLLEDDRPAPEEAVMQSHDAEKRGQWLYEAMESLTDREKLIIAERKLGEEVVTLESLGERLGISKERVRQIEHQALTKLKKSLTNRFGDPEEAGLI